MSTNSELGRLFDIRKDLIASRKDTIMKIVKSCREREMYIDKRFWYIANEMEGRKCTVSGCEKICGGPPIKSSKMCVEHYHRV